MYESKVFITLMLVRGGGSAKVLNNILGGSVSTKETNFNLKKKILRWLLEIHPTPAFLGTSFTLECS